MLNVTHSCHLWAYYPLVWGSTGSTPDTMRMDTPHPQGAYTTTIPRKFHALLLLSQAPFKCNPTTAEYFLYCCIVPIWSYQGAIVSCVVQSFTWQNDTVSTRYLLIQWEPQLKNCQGLSLSTIWCYHKVAFLSSEKLYPISKVHRPPFRAFRPVPLDGYSKPYSI